MSMLMQAGTKHSADGFEGEGGETGNREEMPESTHPALPVFLVAFHFTATLWDMPIMTE